RRLCRRYRGRVCGCNGLLHAAPATGIRSTFVVSSLAIGMRSCFVESGVNTRIGHCVSLVAYAWGVGFRLLPAGG
ncbi:MAG: hypothetical protein ABIR59_03710, partial [Gemmatimonadales bacterium]